MSLAQKLVTLSNRITSRFREKLYQDYSKDKFDTIHLEHLVSLKDREEMLRRLPKQGIVAEIGVNEGDFSEEIISICQPKKMVLIDVWASKRYHGGLFEKVKSRFAHQIKSQQVEIIRDLSFGAIAQCPDQ